jgi:GT2 family glycosyltransferase
LTTRLIIVTVTYNSRGEIEGFLHSLIKIAPRLELEGIIFETRIVDNNSSDGTAQFLSSLNSTFLSRLNIKLTLNPQNIGLSKAINRELDNSRGDLVLLCNPDILFTLDAIQLIGVSNKFPGYGIVPELCNMDGTIQRVSYRRFPTIARITFDFTVAGNLFSRFLPWIKNDYCYKTHRFRSPDYVEQPGGVFLLMHLSDTRRISPFFDPAFPVLWNDVDMALRAKELGIKFLIAPDAKIFHVHAHSLKKTDKTLISKLFYSHLGLIGFATKWKLHPRILQAILFSDTVFTIVFHRNFHKDVLTRFRCSLQ